MRLKQLTVALTAAALAGCYGGGPPMMKKGPAEVIVAEPMVVKMVEWDRFVGRVEPIDAVEVRAKVSGYLLKPHFTEGQMVKAGQKLFTIDKRPFETALRRANDRRAEAEARVEAAEATLKQAQAELEERKSALKLAESQRDRYRSLVQRNAVSREEYDIRVDSAKQAEARVALADAQIKTAEADIKTAEAAVQTAGEEVHSAEINLGYTEVTAKVAGRVSDYRATEGNLITGSNDGQSTLLTTIVSLNPIHVIFDANEREFLKYQEMAEKGERPSSRFNANPIYARRSTDIDKATGNKVFPFVGHMDFVDNRLDRNTSTIRGRAIFRNAKELLEPGLFVELRLPASKPGAEGMLIPDGAVATDQSVRYVYVVGEGNKAVRRSVRLGPLYRGLRVIRPVIKSDKGEIVSGVEPGEKVVIKGLQRVRPGADLAPEDGSFAMDKGEGLPETYEPVSGDDLIRKPGRDAVLPAEGPRPTPEKDKQ